MLITRHPTYGRSISRVKQGGVVLLITLIVLVAMTLTAIALVRSMDTTNVIAGNLAFQQSAAQSGEVAIESAINWLEQNAAFLASDNYPLGYSSSFSNPGTNQSWDSFFTTALAGRTFTLATDANGNTVTYAIERLCLQANTLPGTPGVGCTVTPPTIITVSSSKDSGSVKLIASTQLYYRITVRTVGPHNAKSYIQAIAAL